MSTPASVPSGSKSARGNNNGIDRLSSLSDDLLHHVMSFLSMPEVVRTSILSPRWRYLWASTPFIRIDHQDFEAGNSPGCVDEHKLEKFADHLLLLRDGTVSLDEARISFTGAGKSSVWIRHAIKHKVRLLHVSGHHRYNLDSTAMFPSQHLKRIRLHHVGLSDSFVRPLNYDCHMLEHLELDFCVLNVREISSSSLKVLRITRCGILYGLLICAGNLTHLSIINPISSGAIVTRDLSSLVSASISLRSDKSHYDDHAEVNHRLLDGLSHATMLELHSLLPELALERGPQACPKFSNLTRLVLGDWCMAVDFNLLFRILHRSPRLKELTVNLEMKHQSASSVPTRHAPQIQGYPCIERINVYCSKDYPRVGGLVQALLPIFIPDGKISIEGY